MKIWFIVSVALVFLCWPVMKWGDRPGDDFGRGMLSLAFVGAVALDWLTLIIVLIWRAL